MNSTEADCDYLEKVVRAYGELKGDLHLVELDRGPQPASTGGGPQSSGSNGQLMSSYPSLGLCLAGNRDLGTMSIFVVGFQSGSPAACDGNIRIGDELLEINGHVLYGRSHLNASAIIKSITSRRVRLLLLRSADYLERMAVCPRSQSPLEYKDSSLTLIPKTSKSISLDESPLPDGVAAVLDDDVLTSDVFSNTHVISAATNGIPLSNSEQAAPELVEDEVSQDCTNGSIADVIQSPAEGRENSCAHVTTCAEVHQPQDDSPYHKESLPAAATVNSTSRSSSNKHCLSKSPQVDDGETAQELPRHDGLQLENSNNVSSNCSPEPNAVVAVSATRPIVRHDDLSESVETSPDMSPTLRVATSPTTTTSPHNDDPTSCLVVPGRPTRIDISRGKRGLGLRIIGGSDTFLKAITVYEIFEDGAAARDDRLMPGDQILEVNGEDLRNASHSHAVRVLRHALADLLTVMILRNDAKIDNEIHDQLVVDLVKKPGKGLGLSIAGRRNNGGIIIADIVKGGAAESDGRLAPGDRIMKVNGEDMSHASHEVAAASLKTLMGKVSLTIARLKPGLMPGQRSGIYVGLKKSDSTASDCKHTSRQVAKRQHAVGCYSGCFSSRSSGHLSELNAEIGTAN